MKVEGRLVESGVQYNNRSGVLGCSFEEEMDRERKREKRKRARVR